MSKWNVYRYGANTANQPGDIGPCLVAVVEAEDSREACKLAARRVTLYHNQNLSARLAEEVEAEETEVDRRVKTVRS